MNNLQDEIELRLTRLETAVGALIDSYQQLAAMVDHGQQSPMVQQHGCACGAQQKISAARARNPTQINKQRSVI